MDNFIIGQYGHFKFEKLEKDYRKGFYGIEVCSIKNDDEITLLQRQANNKKLNIGIHFPLRSSVDKSRDPFFLDLKTNTRRKAYERIDEELIFIEQKNITPDLAIARLGCKKFIFHTGYIPLQISKDYREKIIEKQIKFWQDVCDENKDLIICLENIFEKDSSFIYEILDKCKKDNLKLCFDIAHCVVFSDEEPFTWINKMDRYLSHVHLSDCNGIYDEHLALGSGSIDIIALIHKFQKIKCNLTFVIELSGEDKVRKSLNYLERNRLIQRKNAI